MSRNKSEKTEYNFSLTESADELLQEKDIDRITIKVEQRGGG